MCGIVAYVGSKEAESILIDGLTRLEYRGYDSAGIATLHGSSTDIRRAAGKLNNLRKVLQDKPALGSIGIGHTRWATHGKPSENNAHPHHSESITLVHNGIIENQYPLRQNLLRLGRTLNSDTDSEILAHLIALSKKKHSGSFSEAVLKAMKPVKGAFALAIIDEDSPDTVICVKQSCPLLIGIGEGEMFAASDFIALLPYTNKFIVLEDGDMAIVKKDSVTIVDKDHQVQEREPMTMDCTAEVAEKGGYKHFMLKEIFEQPQAVMDTLRGRLSFENNDVLLEGIHTQKLRGVQRITIVACGTSYHAGLMSKHLFENILRIPVEVDLASEFRYRNPIIDHHTLVIGISQSGETADTLAAMQYAKQKGGLLLAICNAVESSVPRLCNTEVGTLYTRAGPEISVASTKAFMTQMAALELLVLGMAIQRGLLSTSERVEHLNRLALLPREIEKVLKMDTEVQQIAKQFVQTADMLFLGRGLLYPVALEGALKMKELSYVHAEGYAAGEMKHGPIALIDQKMPIVVMAPQNEIYEKIISNIEEIKARGGQVIAVGEEGDAHLKEICEHSLLLPHASAYSMPLLMTIPLQLLAYHLADLRGLDVDQPRNLAKSVTVE